MLLQQHLLASPFGLLAVQFHQMSNFVICIANEGYEASLITGKVYRRLPDPEAEAHGLTRVLDEDASSTDGYLYPSSFFVPVELPEKARRALAAHPLSS